MISRIAEKATELGLDWALARNGASHDIYKLDGLMIVIPRHKEVGDLFAVKIYKQCESKLGEGWWK